VASVYTILVVEGRKPTAEHLAPVLNDQGYHTVTARTRREGLTKVERAHPAGVVLDSPSLRFNCWRFCDALQDSDFQIPVLMLLSEGEKIDRSSGAHAYLRYPISNRKLTNRVSKLLSAVLQVGDVIFNVEQRRVIYSKHGGHLTPRQARLLEILMRHPGETLTRSFLMKQVWDTDYIGDTRTLDVHIHWVRNAIEEDPKSPVYLRTVRRVGYRFESPGGE
jgi:DNA-binding response OmpR family regulator